MTNSYRNLAAAALAACSSVCAAAEEAPARPPAAVVTGEIRNPTLREFSFDYASPLALEKTGQEVVLDSLDRFTLTLPVTRGTLLVGHYHEAEPPPAWRRWMESLVDDSRHLVLFVEPGDSLHVVMEVGWLSPSFRFSGRNADNNRFIAGNIRGFLPLRLDYASLEIEDFTGGMDEWRREWLEFLAAGREKYALSEGFIDYAEAHVRYTRAERLISYPEAYLRANREENREITPEYYGFLRDIPLVDETAVGTGAYRSFLVRALNRELDEAPPRSKLSERYDFSRSGLPAATAARLDSLYENRPPRRFSEMFDTSRLGIWLDADKARIDSFFERHNRSYFSENSREVRAPRIDTTGGALVIELPEDQWVESFKRKARLSGEIDLPGLGLSQEAAARLDSIYAHTDPGWGRRVPKRYDLAGERLEGRVLYWFLARELIDAFRMGGEPFKWAFHKWETYREANPFPELTGTVRAALDEALRLQPGQPAPAFTLDDLGGQPVSLDRFRGKAVLLDFWASWCGPCIRDLPFLKRIEEKTAALPVVFLKVSLEEEQAWRKAVDERGIGGVHVTAGGWDSEVAKAYHVTHIPAYYLVDARGAIVERLPGVSEVDEVAAKIEKSL